MERKPTAASAAAAMSVVGVLLVISVVPSHGAVLTVGDALGWTIMGNPNYTAWAANNTFHVGDTIVFTYNTNFHNVLEVSKNNYGACNASSPIGTYATGNDSIMLKHKGHLYFICGFPGHCDAGQRVDIKVSKLSSAAPSPSPSPSPSPTASASSTSPSGSHVPSGASSGISPPASAPKPNSGTKAVPTLLAAIMAVFCFAATSGGLVRQE
ncbi:chemocyanin-like [Curcuma longa]|uniref:chemocyanin-like n=1 Tax=Curcuma longa TaxID=136217 RepID=UPI003D9F62DE